LVAKIDSLQRKAEVTIRYERSV